MAFKLVTPLSEIKKVTYEVSDNEAKQVLIKFMFRVGEECVKEARLAGSYKDQSGALRSSIGYAVVADGIVVKIANPIPGPNGTDKQKGVIEGTKFLSEIAEQAAADSKDKIVLVVTAGMNYAVYVENIHHRIVLSSAEVKAPMLIDKILKELGFK